MSKKNKKKFRAQLSQAIHNLEKNDATKQPVAENIQTNSPAKNTEKISSDTNVEDSYIRKDIKKIALGLGACLVVLLVVWYLNMHTSIISNLSQSLSNALHIGQ